MIPEIQPLTNQRPLRKRVRWHAFRALSIFVLAVTCWTIVVGTSDATAVRRTLVHDGVERKYWVYVPSSYSGNEPIPMVLGLHGLGQSGSLQMAASRMNPVAEREGFLGVYPNAVGGSWSNSPDIHLSFFDALLEAVRDEYSIDPSRVYATGFSQGAIRSFMLAVERPDVFAAIAPVGGVRPLLDDGTLYPGDLPNVPSRPFPLMYVHGTRDNVVPIEGGKGISEFPPVATVLEEWASNNQCDAAPIVSAVPDPRPQDNVSASRHQYQNCALIPGATNATAEVRFFEVHGGTHEWPMHLRFDAANEVWNFLSQYQLTVTPKPGDFNRDGTLSAQDIDQLHLHLGTYDPTYDLTSDGRVNADDRDYWLTELKQTYVGDTTLDGSFDSLDIVAAFEYGQYDDDIAFNSGWAQGDWNGDRDFDAADLVFAFESGGYVRGPHTTPIAIPEPSAWWITCVGLITLAAHRRRTVFAARR